MVGDPQRDAVLRRFARDQWVRLHGTPRVTVIAGGAYAGQLYRSWLALDGTPSKLLEGDDVDRMIREACAHAIANPHDSVAVVATIAAIEAWHGGRADRLAAMVNEGLVVVADPIPTATAETRSTLDARSAAEAVMFEALEATAATAGRFKLNERLAVRFGPTAAEIDLLSRSDRIAIEIDGIHHFADPDCYRRDRRKDLLLQTQGLLVIRVLAEDVMRDPRAAVNVVCQALAYRAAVR